MQAKIHKNGDITVVQLEGRIDFETTEPFRETCQDVLVNNKVVFNLEALSFVGSSGIGAFINTLREFSKNNPVPPKFCNVRSEFKKIFSAMDDQGFQIFEDEKEALTSFNNPKI